MGSEFIVAPEFPHLPIAFRNGSLLLPLKEREKTKQHSQISSASMFMKAVRSALDHSLESILK